LLSGGNRENAARGRVEIIGGGGGTRLFETEAADVLVGAALDDSDRGVEGGTFQEGRGKGRHPSLRVLMASGKGFGIKLQSLSTEPVFMAERGKEA